MLRNTAEISSNGGSNTRFLDEATGDVVVTGIGFHPTLIMIEVDDGSNVGSLGYAAINQCAAVRDGAGGTAIQSGICAKYDSGGNGQYASVTAYSNDGFTLHWVKSGTGAHTALTVRYDCLRANG